MGRFPSPMARIESEYHYPVVGQVQVVERSEFPTMMFEEDTASLDSLEMGDTASFANAAKHRPLVSSTLPRSTSSPVSGWTVLGPSMVLPTRRPRAHSDSEPEPEGYQPPPQPTSLGDALAAALAAAPVGAGAGGGGKKKGKRGKAMVLCAGPPRPVL